MKQILSGGSDGELEMTAQQMEALGYGSAITPLRESGQRRQAQQTRISNKHALTKAGKRQLRVRLVREMDEVLDFFCLHKGCQHRRAQWYLSTGKLDGYPNDRPPCWSKWM